MDIFAKINIIKSMLTDKIGSEDLIKRLEQIESMYSSSNSFYSVTIPKETEDEIDYIFNKMNVALVENPNMEEVEEVKSEVKKPEIYLSFLKDSIKKYVQNLCRLPVPLPAHFDRDSYNKFVSSESKEILKTINEENVTDETLNKILKKLVYQKFDFILDPYRTVYLTNLEHFEDLDEIYNDPKDKMIIDTILLRIKNQDITVEELDYFSHKYPKHICSPEEVSQITTKDKVELSDKDMQILNILSDMDIKIFMEVAKIMGLHDEESLILNENIKLEKKKASNISRLQRVIILPNKYQTIFM